MNMKIKDSIVWTAFLAVMAIIMFPSCSDEHEAGILEITNNERFVMIAASISAAECFTYHICIQIIMKQLKSERYVFK